MMRTVRSVVWAATAACLLAVLVGCAGSASSGASSSGTSSGGGSSAATGGTSASAVTVVEKNYQFAPSSFTVKVGDKVTFANQDSVAHHVMVGTQDLGVQQPGSSVSWTASKNGTVQFSCLIHPSMTGAIGVGAGAAPSAPAPANGGGGSGYGY